jgi:hypothetical protein
LILLADKNSRQKSTQKKPTTREQLYTILILTSYYNSLLIVLVLVLVPFWLNIDTFYFYIAIIFPNGDNGFFIFISKLVRSIANGLLGYHWVVGAGSILSPYLTFISMTSIQLKGLDTTPSISKVMKHRRYNQISILVNQANQVFRWVMAIALCGAGGKL